MSRNDDEDDKPLKPYSYKVKAPHHRRALTIKVTVGNNARHEYAVGVDVYNWAVCDGRKQIAWGSPDTTFKDKVEKEAETAAAAYGVKLKRVSS